MILLAVVSLMDEKKKAEVIDYVLTANMIDKDEAIMVGDRKHDGVLYGYGTKEELMACNSDYLVADINALQELLG